MFDPKLSLAVSSVLTAYYLAECSWRLWRNRPAKYASIEGELVVAFAIVFCMATVLQSVARIVVIAAFLAATTLRLIARHRFAVHDL